MERLEKIYEGKAKIIYTTSDPDLVIQYFKDDATAFNNKKRGPITGKGVIDAVMPGKCAAPPAPAIITLRPRPRAFAA